MESIASWRRGNTFGRAIPTCAAPRVGTAFHVHVQSIAVDPITKNPIAIQEQYKNINKKLILSPLSLALSLLLSRSSTIYLSSACTVTFLSRLCAGHSFKLFQSIYWSLI
jgi:hypothetical protein